MPQSPSALCTINGYTLPTSGHTGIDVAASSTITIALINTDGVNSWSIYATSADDVTEANGNLVAVNNSAIIDYVHFTATFVVPPMVDDGYRGAALQFTSTVNNGMYNSNQTTFRSEE